MLKRIVQFYAATNKLITGITGVIKHSLVQVDCLFQVPGQSGGQF